MMMTESNKRKELPRGVRDDNRTEKEEKQRDERSDMMIGYNKATPPTTGEEHGNGGVPERFRGG